MWEGSFKAVRNAEERVRSAGKRGLPETAYATCGRKRDLTDVQGRAVVTFVKKWRAKRFCTCLYIAQELKLDVTPRTVANVFNRHGYHWRRRTTLRFYSWRLLLAGRYECKRQFSR